jgi:hypothetical protein
MLSQLQALLFCKECEVKKEVNKTPWPTTLNNTRRMIPDGIMGT